MANQSLSTFKHNIFLTKCTLANSPLNRMEINYLGPQTPLI